MDKLLLVKHISSPIGKLIAISEVCNRLIPGGIQINDADQITKIVTYAFVKLGKRGADFYIDLLYLTYFSSDFVQGKVDAWSYITHMEASLHILQEGLDSYLNN